MSKGFGWIDAANGCNYLGGLLEKLGILSQVCWVLVVSFGSFSISHVTDILGDLTYIGYLENVCDHITDMSHFTPPGSTCMRFCQPMVHSKVCHISLPLCLDMVPCVGKDEFTRVMIGLGD